MSRGKGRRQGGQQPRPQGDAKAKRTKVAIVGFTDHKKLAPFKDKDFEIWGLNALFSHGQEVPRADRWFDLHPVDVISQDRWEWYAGQKIPVYLQQLVEAVPSAVEFPAERLRQLFRSFFTEEFDRRTYYTSSIAWMIAFAILEGFKEIHVYGVDMSQDEEYFGQRNGVEFWMGVCAGKGITLYVPQASDLLGATHEYGYGSDGGFRAKLTARLAELNRQCGQLDRQVREMQDQRLITEGAKQGAQWALQSWGVADHTSMDPSHPEVGDQPQLELVSDSENNEPDAPEDAPADVPATPVLDGPEAEVEGQEG